MKDSTQIVTVLGVGVAAAAFWWFFGRKKPVTEVPVQIAPELDPTPFETPEQIYEGQQLYIDGEPFEFVRAPAEYNPHEYHTGLLLPEEAPSPASTMPDPVEIAARLPGMSIPQPPAGGSWGDNLAWVVQQWQAQQAMGPAVQVEPQYIAVT